MCTTFLSQIIENKRIGGDILVQRVKLKDGKFCMEDQPIQGNYVPCVVYHVQHLRAQWSSYTQKIVCASVNDLPVTRQPVSYRCDGCPSASKCKLAMKFWIVIYYANHFGGCQ